MKLSEYVKQRDEKKQQAVNPMEAVPTKKMTLAEYAKQKADKGFMMPLQSAPKTPLGLTFGSKKPDDTMSMRDFREADKIKEPDFQSAYAEQGVKDYYNSGDLLKSKLERATEKLTNSTTFSPGPSFVSPTPPDNENEKKEYQTANTAYTDWQKSIYAKEQNEKRDYIETIPQGNYQIGAVDTSGDYADTKANVKYIFDDNFKKEQQAKSAAGGGDAWGKYDYLDDKEKSVLSYYASQGDWEKADEYLKLLDNSLSSRQLSSVAQTTQETAEKYPGIGVLSNVVSSFAAPAAYAATGVQAIENRISGKYEPTNPEYFTGAQIQQSSAQGVQGAAYKSVLESTGSETAADVASWAASTGLSILDYASKIPLGPGALAFMGAEAAGNTSLQAQQNGGTPEQAFVLGTATGIIEMATEKLPLDMLMRLGKTGTKGVKSFLSNSVKQGGVEFAEESISQLATTITDIAIMGEKSGFNQYVEYLKTQGYSDQDAYNEALFQYFAKNTLSAGLSGFVSGGVMGGGFSIGGAIANNKAEKATGAQIKDSADEVISYGLQTKQDSEAYKTASELQGQKLSGQEVSEKDLGKLYNQISQMDVERTDSYGKVGKSVYGEIITSDSTDIDKREFDLYYRTGKSMLPLTSLMTEQDTLTPIREKAYNAGLSDTLSSYKNHTVLTENTANGFIKNDLTKSMDTYTKRSLDELAKASGVKITISPATGTAGVNGFFDSKTNTVYIAQDAANPALVVAKHEITHRLAKASPEGYKAYRDYVTAQLGEAFINKRTAQIKALYSAQVNQSLSDEEAIEEVVADFTESLLTDETKIQRLVDENKTIARHIFDAIRRFLEKIRSAKYKTEQMSKYGLNNDQIEKAEKLWSSALKNAGTKKVEVRTADTKYSVKEIGFVLPNGVVANLENYKEHYSLMKALQKDGSINPNVDSVNDIVGLGVVRFKPNVGIEISAETEPTKKQYEAIEKFIDDFDAAGFSVDFSIEGSVYGALTYEPWEIETKRIVNDIKKHYKSDVRFPLKDSLGNTLTPEQAEFFKDSKVRDKDGNLLVVYHGTKTEFTEFVSSKGGEFGPGVYLTENADTAKWYSEYVARGDGEPKTLDGYVNITNPYTITKTEYIRKTANTTPGTVRAKLEKQGYDGIVGIGINGYEKQYVAFSPNQIKSIDNKTPTSDPDIRYSLKETKNEEIINKAVDVFGTTFQWAETGYLTTDGKRLDFSGRREGASGGYRTEDHREIWYAYGEPSGVEGWETMVDFMAKGNIRILPENGGINLSVAPTKEQETKLRAYIERNTGEVTVDFDDVLGNTRLSVEYPKRTSSTKIIEDMRKYFVDGTEPTVSEVSKYRYSLKSQSDLATENAKLREMNEYLKSQFKLSEGITTDPKKVSKYASKLLDRYDSNYDEGELTKRVQSLYDLIANGKDADGNELTWEFAKSQAAEIAQDVLNESSTLNDDMYQQYSGLRKYFKKVKIKIADNYKSDLDSMGGYNEFRKRNFGKFTLSAEGTPMDEVYAELSFEYPEFFNQEDTSNQADQIIQIADVLDSMKPVYENQFGGYMDEATEIVSNEIMDEFFDIPQVKTYADKHAQKMIEERIKRANQINQLREQKNDRINQIKKSSSERVVNLMRQESKRRLDLSQKLQSQYKSRTTEAREKRNSTALRARIRRISKDLSVMLNRPTDKRHIPDSLKKAVGTFINTIDFSKEALDKGNAKDIYVGLALMKTAFDSAQNGSDYFDVDPDLGTNIDNLESLDGKPIKEMTLDEYRTLYEIAKSVQNSVRNYNKLFSMVNRMYVGAYGNSVLDELRTSKAFKDSRFAALNWSRELLNVQMLSSFEFFEELGPSFNELFKKLRAGLDKKISNTAIAQEYMQDLLKDADVDEWTGNKSKLTTFELSDGDIDLTVSQVMSLYLLNKQEAGKNHIYAGGIRLKAPTIGLKDGKKVITDTPEAIKVTIEDVGKIISSLTPEQIKIADGISKFFTDVTAKWGNEVSDVMYGYSKFTEKDYFPIVSDDNYVLTTFAEKQDGTLANRGSTKSRVRKANNPIYIEDAFDVFTRQADFMGSYNAFVIPLSDMQKVFNFKNEDGSVKQAIQKKLGPDANKYFKQFMADLNGGIRSDFTNKTVGMMTKAYKAAKIGLNLRVILQQPTSMLRAAAVIDTKYLIKGSAQRSNWNEVLLHAPIAKWRDMGYFSLDTGRQMKDVFLDKGRLTDKFMWLIGKADQFAWGRMWNAVKAEIDDTTNLDKGSQAYWDAVSERFSEVIDNTQVVDTVFHRSQIMRSDNSLAKIITSFMSEPTRIFNMLAKAARYIGSGDKELKRKATRLISSVISSLILNSIVTALIDAYRDVDKDEPYGEKFVKKLLGTPERGFMDGNLAEQATGMVPFVKDVFSIFKGFTSEAMYLEGISALYNSGKKLFDYTGAIISGEEPRYRLTFIMKDILSSVGLVTGVPVGNVTREVETLLGNTFKAIDQPLANFAVKKVLYNIASEENRALYYGLLFAVSPDGSNPDEGAYTVIKADMLANGFTKTGIESAMKSRIKKGADFTAVQKDEVKKLTSSVTASSDYDKLSPEFQEKAIDYVEMYVNAVTMGDISGYDVEEKSWIDKARNGSVDVEDYILFKAFTAEGRAETQAAADSLLEWQEKTDKETFTRDDVVDILDKMAISNYEKSFLYETMYSDKNNPY